jgi:acyl-coenzyme A synthetase/AMP-(fatty) acid ligase
MSIGLTFACASLVDQQVPPAELEALLLTNDEIIDAAVIGIEDKESGELPKAFVVLKDGSSLSEDDVKEFVKGKVATYKQLAEVARALLFYCDYYY